MSKGLKQLTPTCSHTYHTQTPTHPHAHHTHAHPHTHTHTLKWFLRKFSFQFVKEILFEKITTCTLARVVVKALKYQGALNHAMYLQKKKKKKKEKILWKAKLKIQTFR